MARNSIYLSLSLTGLIAYLSVEIVQAGSSVGAKTNANAKLYHERKESQIEEVFRKLPSIENEIESMFDDASFFSSFEPSPQADQKSNEVVEDLFRRILRSQEEGQEKVEGRTLSFLNDKLQEANVSGGTGNVRNGRVRGSAGGMSGAASAVQNSPGTIDADPNPVGNLMARVDALSESGNYKFENFVTDMNAPFAPITITTQKVGHYQFNFPTIQHTIFSGPIHLKAHSSVDLTPLDPEIFAVLQSILTPYLQKAMGPTLHAYNLEVDYSPGRDDNVGKYDVVTVLEVKCTFKVISSSIESFQFLDNAQASQWIRDFFDGPELYKLIEALKKDSIPVNDIVFINEEFEVSKTISEANSQSFGKSSVNSNSNEESSSGAAMIGVTMSVLVVGLLFFMHYTGRLPSKGQIGQFTLDARDSIAKRVPSSLPKLGKKKRGNDDELEGGRRRRTFSGTFRRFPEGGLQKAAIQKKPAMSEKYLGDSASDSSSSTGSPRVCKTSSSFGDMDDYSFSHYGGDYGPPTPNRQTIPMTPTSHRSEDEFSMPDTYDSAHERRGETLLGKVGKTAASLISPGRKQQDYSIKSPIPSRAPRRVTARDIASPNDVDNWSIQSYETEDASHKTPSNHPLYRGWNEAGPEMRRPQPPGELHSSESRKATLSMPFFS